MNTHRSTSPNLSDASPSIKKADLEFSDGLYLLSPTAEPSDRYDHLHAKASQLAAMLHVITGGGYEAFSECGDALKADYLWGCTKTAEEIRDLIAVPMRATEQS